MHSYISLSSFPKKLKEETAELHQSLENLPLSKRLLQPDLTREEYLQYLDLMNDVISEVELEIFPLVSSVISDIDQRKKVHTFQHDFDSLNFEIKGKKEVFDLSNKENLLPFGLGILYVIEGSTLGGKVIFKHVQKALGLDQNNGASYFYGYGEKTGDFWKSFMIQLSNYENLHQNGDEIIAGANFAFQCIHHHFLVNSAS